MLGFRAKWFIGFKAFKGAYLGNIPSKYVIYLLSIYISINFCILGQFCDLGVPRLPRASVPLLVLYNISNKVGKVNGNLHSWPRGFRQI